MEPVAALDDRYAELLFELSDAARQRRLGDVAGLCGTREVFFPGERDEVLKLVDIHVGSRVIKSENSDPKSQTPGPNRRRTG